MESIDEASHTATMQAQGTDKRGQGGAKATINSRLAPVDGAGTRVEVVTDYHITGRLARFGRGGMIEDISERLLREFAKRLQSSLAAQPDAVAETIVSQRPAPESEPPLAPTIVSGTRAGLEPEEPAAPAPAADEPFAPVARDHTTFAPAPPAGEVTPPPPEPPAAEPPAAEPTGVGAGPEAGVGAEPGIEPPAPPPPPSPGPPPVVTPPPAPSAVPPPPPGASGRPPLEHPPQPSEPMQGLSLIGGVVWGRVKRNPAPAAAAAGVAVVLLMARRRRRRH
jgi:hypothetical protein